MYPRANVISMTSETRLSQSVCQAVSRVCSWTTGEMASAKIMTAPVFQPTHLGSRRTVLAPHTVRV